MTRKDYIAIAEAIAVNNDPTDSKREQDKVKVIAGSIADVMKRDNPRFDRSRFLRACGFDY